MSSGHALLNIEPGTDVWLHGRRKVITHVLDFDEVLVADSETGKVIKAKIHELKGSDEAESDSPPDLTSIPESDWQKAHRKFEIIEPLLKLAGRSRRDVEKRAGEYGCHPNTLYGWIRIFESTGRITSLLPQQRSDKGAKRLDDDVEIIVNDLIQSEYLSKQKKSVKETWKEIRKKCKNAGLDIPHINTVRIRIAGITVEEKTARRRGVGIAEKTSRPLDGSFPGADWPLAVVQIDHTEVDLILVDDIYRLPVGRPWITVAIDVFSRMILGFYISFDPPGAMATGLCIAHATLPKEEWLAKRGIGGEWPCWGIPAKLHADNAREFRGNMLKRACRNNGIDLEWRPVKKPRYGAHIERLIGTSMNEVHNLPGTTFSNARERQDYDSEGKAIMTLSEFEAWYATYIVNEYHCDVHSALGMPPIAKYRKGIFGDDNRPGTGLPARINDEARLRLDLMPFEERTIQNYGVAIDGIHYYHDVLRRWINAPNPKTKKVKRKFTFRRDPRLISPIWFYDPELNSYFPIPYRNTSHPLISVWELREAKRRLKTEGKSYVNEDAIFESHERRREMERAAKGKTAAVRRAQQRRKHAEDTIVTAQHTPEPATFDSGEMDMDIVPFDEMDDLSS